MASFLIFCSLSFIVRLVWKNHTLLSLTNLILTVDVVCRQVCIRAQKCIKKAPLWKIKGRIHSAVPPCFPVQIEVIQKWHITGHLEMLNGHRRYLLLGIWFRDTAPVGNSVIIRTWGSFQPMASSLCKEMITWYRYAYTIHDLQHIHSFCSCFILTYSKSLSIGHLHSC